MWKKEDGPIQPPAPQPAVAPRPEREAPRTSAPGDIATIGRSITIKGEVSGDEDLLIQGRVEGSVDLRQHAVTVGSEGEVKASIIGRVVTVQGRVEGNITAEEQVILRNTAAVQGDIAAPRLVLEDGARFRGGVDMGDANDRTRRTTNGVSTQTQPQGRKTPDSGKPLQVDALADKDKSAKDSSATSVAV